MRSSALSVFVITIVSFAVVGAVQAQNRMPQPTGQAKQTGQTQPASQTPPAGQTPPGAGGQAGRLPAGAQVLPGMVTAPAANEATYRQQVSYAIGRDFGGSYLRANEIPVDLQALIDGIKDALTDAKPKWTDAELQATMTRFSEEMRQKSMMRLQQIVAKNKKEAEAFLAANKTKDGVQVTPSGLQYKVLKQGRGASPTSADVVRFHYRGTFLNGTEFQSSFGGEPATLPVGKLIPGWTEAMQKMHVGDRWQLFLPSNLAYGDDPNPDSPIEPGSALVFEVELLDIVK